MTFRRGAQLDPGVTQETWTHGSSAQRQHRFQAGLDDGKADVWDTFRGSI